ncbi:uroporphyrinogen-III C-methyltransferase [Thiolinea disciformis]|uniref:uroporphyrinogen-III C-methyltransferase n=1 Tax=Thiolinea disciformis TaxID=125614 RepID=UPI00036A39BC|nr:uroporphyrinogen-III C-methyltransferase [Thiolinea disciformis]
MIDKSESITTSKHLASTARPKSRGAGFALFIAFLALFFTVAGIATGYRHWQRMNDKAKANSAAIEELAAQLTTKTDAGINRLRTELDAAINNTQATIQQDLKTMTQLNQETRQFAQTVTQQATQISNLQERLQNYAPPLSSEEWKLEEVIYLLNIANRELHITRQPSLAIQVLRQADERLEQLGSVSLLPVRQQIRREIGALEQLQHATISDISQQISQLAKAFQTVPIPHIEVAATTTPATTSFWQSIKNKAYELWTDTVVVTRLDQPIKQVLDEQTQTQITQLLQLRLENLRLLALQQQNEAYHAQIALIRDTLSAYYPSALTQPWLQALDSLDAINLTPQLPDISGSAKQLQSALSLPPVQGEQP